MMRASFLVLTVVRADGTECRATARDVSLFAYALDQDGGMFTVLGSGEDGPSYSGPVPCMDH